MRTRVLASASASLVFIGLAHAAPPGSWQFQLQCRSSLDPNIPAFNLPNGSSLSSQSVSLDEDGTVSTRVVLGIPGATEGIFVGRNGVGSLVNTVNSEDPVYSSDLALRNGRLAVSFLLDPTTGANVYDTEGNLLQTFPNGGSEGVEGFSSLSITSDGALGYRGNFGSGKKNIIDEYVKDTRIQTQIANTYDGQYSFLFGPHLNDARQMAGKVLLNSGAQAVIFWEADGSAHTIASTLETFNAFVNSTDLAQNGLVAFTGRRASDSIWQVTRSDGDTLTDIAQGGEMGIANSSLANFPPVINSDGWVAFRPSDAVSTALYVGDGEGLVKLIEYGQLIDTDLGRIELGFDFGGSTGKQVMNGNIAINDAGQIAFAAFLHNGTIGVFVATPDAGCTADWNADGELNFFDAAAYLDDFANHDPAADLTGDAVFDFFDVAAFLDAFSGGC